MSQPGAWAAGQVAHPRLWGALTRRAVAQWGVEVDPCELAHREDCKKALGDDQKSLAKCFGGAHLACQLKSFHACNRPKQAYCESFRNSKAGGQLPAIEGSVH